MSPWYLAFFALASSVLAGALTLALIGRLTDAKWYFEAARRPAEALAAWTLALAALLVPVVLGANELYPWATRHDERSPFLNVRFFALRSALYVATWSTLAVLLPRAPRKTSALGLVLVGVTVNFAAFDWFMSLEPEWYSTAYGIYFWSGGFLAALAACILLGKPHPELAKLLLTASIFWAYVAFAQALIVWIAGVPRENAWFLVRTRGPWSEVAIAIGIAKFLVPFLLLLPYSWKRSARLQRTVSALVLAGHALDMAWLVLPAREAPA